MSFRDFKGKTAINIRSNTDYTKRTRKVKRAIGRERKPDARSTFVRPSYAAAPLSQRRPWKRERGYGAHKTSPRPIRPFFVLYSVSEFTRTHNQSLSFFFSSLLCCTVQSARLKRIHKHYIERTWRKTFLNGKRHRRPPRVHLDSPRGDMGISDAITTLPVWIKLHRAMSNQKRKKEKCHLTVTPRVR